MTVAQQSNRYLDRPAPSSLADVINTILDKGLVIDVYIRVSLVGIELLTIDARIVIASVDTYLRFAEAVNRLDLNDTQTHGIPELMEDLTESGAKGKTSGALEGVKEKVTDFLGDGEDGERKHRQTAPRQQQRHPTSRTREKSHSSQSRSREEE